MMTGTNFWKNLGVIVLVLLSAIFIAMTCKQMNEPEPNHYIDPRLQSYYDSFLKDAEKAGLKPGHDIAVLDIGSIDEKEMGPNVIGACWKKALWHHGMVHRVYIIRIIDEFSPEAVMKGLIYHELGHCVYDLPHDKDIRELMYWEIQWDLSDEERDQQIARMFMTIKRNQ